MMRVYVRKMDGNVEENGDVFTKKVQERTFGGKLKKYFMEYCVVSSIHGVRYFGERRRTILEKIWWLIAIGVSCAFCISRIIDAYQKWERSPVIVSFATSQTPIWQIPFPAVTICPDVKSNAQIFNYTDILQKKRRKIPTTHEEQVNVNFEHMSMICERKYDQNFTTEFVRDEEIYDFFDKMAGFIKNNLIEDVLFMGMLEDKAEAFTPIITEEGVCYTFNILDREEIYSDAVKHYKNYHKSTKSKWSLEKGYQRNVGKDVYPRRALFPGALAAFDVMLVTLNEGLDYACTAGVLGYKVQIHHPAQIPSVREEYFRVPLDQFVVIAITPNMMMTSDDVKDYSPKKRECYFPTERKLRFFNFYTQQNCQIECKTNYTLKICDCVNFYMPHDDNTYVCGAANIDCTTYAEYDMLTNFIDSKLQNVSQWKKRKIDRDDLVYDCDCLPTCISIQYSMELSQNKWNWELYLESERIVNYTDREFRLSHLKIFFKLDQFIPSIRHQLYGSTDLFANFGGLLGLFLGFSVLSFVEIVYFVSVRLLGNVIINGRRYCSGMTTTNGISGGK